MSIKNLPLTTYLDSRSLIRAAILTEIRAQKEEAMRLEIAAYELQLTEEVNASILEFQQANTPVDNEPALNAEFEAKREAFVEQLAKEKAQKLEELSNSLALRLKTEMSYLQKVRFSQLALEHTGPLTSLRLGENIQKILDHFSSSPHLFTFLLKLDRTKLLELNSFLNKLYVNAFVDPLFMLFLYRLEGTSLRLHEKFRKVRIRKFKMKRKKVRKLYVFRKLKKVILFRKLKKRYFVKTAYNMPLLSLWLNKGSKTLIKRIPVSTRVIEATSVEFFYKMNKKFNRNLVEDYDLVDEEVTEFIIYLRNYHQKPYFKFRKARMAH